MKRRKRNKMQLIDGIRRLIYGATTFFEIKQGSTALNGTSYVELYKERLEYPTTVLSFDIKCEGKSKAEFRFTCNGEKVFPFTAANTIPEGLTSVIPIEFPVGSLMCLEVKGMAPKDSFIIVLSEMDCIVRK